MKLYAEISKTESQDDGTIKVWGYASSEAVDSDGETVTAEAMKAAIPDYMKWGAVREMHQPSAAGTAIECRVEDDGRTLFGAHIVDSEAVKRCRRTSKGFSIGGKVTSRDELNKSIIKGLKLVEISLVDRPANPEAVITVCKIDGDAIKNPPSMRWRTAQQGRHFRRSIAGTGEGRSAGRRRPEEGLVHGQSGLPTCWIHWRAFAPAVNGELQRRRLLAVPQALRDWLKEGAKILQDMAAEEVAEMVSELKARRSNRRVRIWFADKTGRPCQGGGEVLRSRSRKTRQGAPGHPRSWRPSCQHRIRQGLRRRRWQQSGPAADLAKVAGERDLAKAEAVKIAAERDALQKRVQELEALPAPGKAFLRAVAKGEDAGAEDEPASKVAPVIDHRGDINEAATLIKMIRAGAPVVK